MLGWRHLTPGFVGGGIRIRLCLAFRVFPSRRESRYFSEFWAQQWLACGEVEPLTAIGSTCDQLWYV